MPLLPALSDLIPRVRCGVLEYPLHHMRGGTSTGLVLHTAAVPPQPPLRAELLQHLMGVPLDGEAPLPGSRQVTGLGRGTPTSNKVFLVDVEQHEGQARLVSTLAQLAGGHGLIDWSVNCGNMSSALQLWGLDAGVIEAPAIGMHEIAIRNTNTGVVTTSRMERQPDGSFESTAIPGVRGSYPQVDLFLHQPAGAKTGRLLPTGAARNRIGRYTVSCVDVAVPMVIALASEFGKTAQEAVAELEADTAFMQAIREVWSEAGLLMGLRRSDGQPMTREELEHSETIPKFCIVGAATGAGNIAVRYFTPQAGHASLAVSGGCCLAAACLIPGTVAHGMAHGVPAVGQQQADIAVGIENPAGVLDTTIVARQGESAIDIVSAAYRRSAQILLRGHMPLYRASADLKAWLLRQAW